MLSGVPVEAEVAYTRYDESGLYSFLQSIDGLLESIILKLEPQNDKQDIQKIFKNIKAVINKLSEIIANYSKENARLGFFGGIGAGIGEEKDSVDF